jgi:transposase
VPDRAVLTGIVFVLQSGICWEMLPKEMGCGSGSTCWRCLKEWHEAGVWRRLHQVLVDRLGKSDRTDWERSSLGSASVQAKGGEAVGRKPTDRGKQGSKRHLVADGDGVPLAIALTVADVHDSKMFEKLIDSIEPIKRSKGRPRKRPKKLHVDKPYDARKCRQALRKRRIKSRIARKGKERASGWGVTGGWLIGL